MVLSTPTAGKEYREEDRLWDFQMGPDAFESHIL